MIAAITAVIPIIHQVKGLANKAAVKAHALLTLANIAGIKLPCISVSGYRIWHGYQHSSG